MYIRHELYMRAVTLSFEAQVNRWALKSALCVAVVSQCMQRAVCVALVLQCVAVCLWRHMEIVGHSLSAQHSWSSPI